jgi:hypothetical protein
MKHHLDGHMSYRATAAIHLALMSLGLAACSSDHRASNSADADVDSRAVPINAGDDDTLASPGEFSFFALSLKFVKSKAPCAGADSTTCLGGFGGDLRNGKANGIDGADSLCEEAANLANPGDRHQWRAFLSAGSYNGAVLNAIDRIGSGPWYSAPPTYQQKTNYASEGLLVALNKEGLLSTRPNGDTTTIVYNGVNQSMGAGKAESWPFSQCLTNEYGHCVQQDGDTHDTLTGTNNDGTYAGSQAATCDDWTNGTKGYGSPVYGHTWPRQLNATDNAAKWISIGERMNNCGAVINVSSTNFAGTGSGTGTPGDNQMPEDDRPGFAGDGGMGPGGPNPSAWDGGFDPGMGFGPWEDGGMGPGGNPMRPDDGRNPFPQGDGGFTPSGGMGNPPDPGDGGTPGNPTSGAGSGLGMGSEDSPYAGGVGSGGGYGAFYCFALITGSE